MERNERRTEENKPIRQRLQELEEAYERHIVATNATLEKFTRRVYKLFVVLIIVALIPGYLALRATNDVNRQQKTIKTQQQTLTAEQSIIQSQQKELARDESRLKNDEQATCTIQASGLPAQHALTFVMQDLLALVVQPPNPTQPPEPPELKKIVDDLNHHLHTYVHDTNETPTTRQC